MPSTISGAVLDHVALAVERWSDAWPRYAVELGGTWSSGGFNVGFAPAQLRYANDGRVEVLQPWQPEDNPFLRRFLDRHGPCPHHLTFKVPDLPSALDRAQDAGFSPVGVDLTNADWKEAFLHPRQATGIVVQLAQATYAWESAAPEGFPIPRPGSSASLLRVTHAVAELDQALALFEGLLGGRPAGRAVALDGTWQSADLQWSGPPVLRLVAPTPGSAAHTSQAEDRLAPWLGELAGRLHHLAFALAPAPAGAPVEEGRFETRTDVPGVALADGAVRVIDPPDNLGTRLVLTRTDRGVAAAFDSLGRAVSEAP